MERHPKTIRLGTRGSLLARTQTEWVAAQLRKAHPDLEILTIFIQTTGDKRRDVPFAQVGTKGMFVKEIEQALLDKTIDVGVHSLKDMPGDLPAGLELGCVPIRESPYDAFLTREGTRLADLKEGAIVGTSSIRRQAQLRHYRPDLHLEELRGNLDTRLRKLEEGLYDAIVLACAGLNRLGLGDRITESLSSEICLPAVGQGALALETRADDHEIGRLLLPLQDQTSAVMVTAERGFQSALNGGCTIPAGALARPEGDRFIFEALIASPDGAAIVREREFFCVTDAATIGATVAERLLARGGRAFLGRNL